MCSVTSKLNPNADILIYQHIATTAGSSVLQIAMELEDWNMVVLDSLLKYRDIERDNFDSKGRKLVARQSRSRKQRLETHLCAMANTVTIKMKQQAPCSKIIFGKLL